MFFGGVGVVLEVFSEVDYALCVVFDTALVLLWGEVVGVHGFIPFVVMFLVYHMCTWCCQLMGGCVVSHYILFTVASAVFSIV